MPQIRPITSETCESVYPSGASGVSFTTSCSGNPSLNSLLTSIDSNAQTKTYITVSHSCSVASDFKCDGVADQVEINSAISYALSAPARYAGVVLIGDTDYVLTAPVVLPVGTQNFKLMSIGGKATLRPSVLHAHPCIQFNNSSLNTIENLYLKDGQYNLFINSGSGNTFKEVTFDNSLDQHLAIANGYWNSITNCRFIRAGKGAVIIGVGGNKSDGTRIIGNHFELNNQLDFAGLYSVIMVDTGNQGVVNGNVSIDNGLQPNRAKRFVETVGVAGNANGWAIAGNTSGGLINVASSVVLSGTAHLAGLNTSI